MTASAKPGHAGSEGAKDEVVRAGLRSRARWLVPDSGPVVARLIHSLVGLVFVIAFGSLLVQLQPLLGSDGLSPIAETLAAERWRGFFAMPTLFWWWSSDAALHVTAGVGVLAGALALVGVFARASLLVAAVLYLSFVSVGQPFLAFQWDLFLVEAGVLSALLPRDRTSPLAHVLLSCLVFKLYFESGLVKWWSPIGDWRDGSAMSYYYETAPLPGPLAWYAHHLPGWWHTFESWATLGLELVLPFFVFCGRRGRLAVFFGLGGFQLLNLATANYGFFVYLALVTHLVLVSDADLLRLYARLPGRRWWGRVLLPRGDGGGSAERRSRVRTGFLGGFAAVYLGLSLLAARVELGGEASPTLVEVRQVTRPLALFNVYHLFQQITRVRIEPEFYALVDETLHVYDLPYKPGPVDRRPRVVAPYQPRLDFQLWFFGLRAGGWPPVYVGRLVERLCRAPEKVQRLFAVPLAERPSHVYLQMWRYNFTQPGESGWWRREPVGPERVIPCPRDPGE